jgi:hypothetical protein
MANLHEYESGNIIREATPEEVEQSNRAAQIDGGAGIFEVEIDGQLISVYADAE